jgi:ribosomal protein L9
VIGFYRDDTGEKLLLPNELAEALQIETQARQEAERQVEQEKQKAEQERQKAEDLASLLDQYRERFGNLS